MGTPIFTNSGYCNICETETKFVAIHEWLRDWYLCETCRTCPRQRAIVEVLSQLRPNWRELEMHESSPCMWFFRDQCPGYTYSYFFEDVARGGIRNGDRCEDLEQLTFEDSTFDVFITQDVMEHVFHPEQVCREVMRVLKPWGLYLFTAPKHKHLLHSVARAKKLESGDVEHLLPAEYHGNPISDEGSLVTWDYGTDFDDLLKTWTGYNVSDIVLRDRNRGIDGEYLDVFYAVKDPVNKLH